MKMLTPMLAAAIAACLPALSTTANAATTWRCGNTYSDRPCPDGRPVSVDDVRDPARRQEADRDAREARATADRLERDRLAAASASHGRQATLLEHRRAGAATDPSGTASDQRKRKAKNNAAQKTAKTADFFSAHDPVATARNRAERKARSAKRGSQAGKFGG